MLCLLYNNGGDYLQVELLSGCAKSLEYIQCRVAAIHVFRVEVALHKLTCLFFDPGFYFVSTNQYKIHFPDYIE